MWCSSANCHPFPNRDKYNSKSLQGEEWNVYLKSCRYEGIKDSRFFFKIRIYLSWFSFVHIFQGKVNDKVSKGRESFFSWVEATVQKPFSCQKVESGAVGWQHHRVLCSALFTSLQRHRRGDTSLSYVPLSWRQWNRMQFIRISWKIRWVR